ncbi:MAG: hypothetical protein J2O49_01745, partial [Sciscionella sp.]|nr:hypothetical protein [Sciscionella sp.]
MPLPGSAREEAALTGSSPAGRSIGLVGLSVIASGLLINAFLAVVAHNVSTEQYGFFTAYWSMALVVGFGVFLPIEQEFTRLAHSAGAGGGVLRSGLRVALGFAAVEVVLVLAGTPLLLHSFGGEFGTVAALATLCVISAGQFTVRGLLLGANRMTSYALVLTADAALRVTLAALLAGLLRPANASSYAWTLVLAIGVAHLPLLPKLVR